MVQKLFYTMGEVAEMFDVNQSLIRHWEGQFSELKPKRNKKGNRLFTRQDVEYLKQIYHLVKELGMTLEGARKILKHHRDDGAVACDVEMMERLQKIRALLAEVREELKICANQVDTDRAVETDRIDEKLPDTEVDDEPASEDDEERPMTLVEEVEATMTPEMQKIMEDQTMVTRRSRRSDSGEEEAQDKELFAFYEQSLF